MQQITDLDAELLAVDPHEGWSAKYLLNESGLTTDDLNYPIVTDPSITVSATYGVAFQMRIHVEVSNRPTLFVIDKSGRIRYEKRAATFADRPTVDQIIQELNKLQTPVASGGS